MVNELHARKIAHAALDPGETLLLEILEDALGAFQAFDERAAGREIASLAQAARDMGDTIAQQRRMGEEAREELHRMSLKLDGRDAQWEMLRDVGDEDDQSTERLRVRGGWLYRVREWEEAPERPGLALALAFVPDWKP